MPNCGIAEVAGAHGDFVFDVAIDEQFFVGCGQFKGFSVTFPVVRLCFTTLLNIVTLHPNAPKIASQLQ